MKQMAGEMQLELETTRTELRRGVLELPQETAESTRNAPRHRRSDRSLGRAQPHRRPSRPRSMPPNRCGVRPKPLTLPAAAAPRCGRSGPTSSPPPAAATAGGLARHHRRTGARLPDGRSEPNGPSPARRNRPGRAARQQQWRLAVLPARAARPATTDTSLGPRWPRKPAR